MSRLSYPTEDAKARNIDPNKWGVLCDIVFTGTNNPAMILTAYDYAVLRGYDPYGGHVAIVEQSRRVKGTKQYETYETVWPTLKALVYAAHKTGDFAGVDPMVYGDTQLLEFGNREDPVKVEAPEWVTCTVFRYVKGQRCAFTETVFYREFMSQRNGIPTFIWQSKARLMIAKCAKAAALRLAFAECDYSAEEMEGKVMEYNDSSSADSSNAQDYGGHVEHSPDDRSVASDRQISMEHHAGALTSFRDLSGGALEWFAEHLQTAIGNRAFGPAIAYAKEQCLHEDFPLCQRLLKAAEEIALANEGDQLFNQFERCLRDAPAQGIRVFEWLRKTVKGRSEQGFLNGFELDAVNTIIDFYEALIFPEEQRHVA